MKENGIVQIGTSKRLVSTSNLIKLYPVFNSRNITMAIRMQKLPYMQIGRKRYFNLPDVEKWFEERQLQQIKENECMYRY